MALVTRHRLEMFIPASVCASPDDHETGRQKLFTVLSIITGVRLSNSDRRGVLRLFYNIDFITAPL